MPRPASTPAASSSPGPDDHAPPLPRTMIPAARQRVLAQPLLERLVVSVLNSTSHLSLATTKNKKEGARWADSYLFSDESVRDTLDESATASEFTDLLRKLALHNQGAKKQMLQDSWKVVRRGGSDLRWSEESQVQQGQGVEGASCSGGGIKRKQAGRIAERAGLGQPRTAAGPRPREDQRGSHEDEDQLPFAVLRLLLTLSFQPLQVPPSMVAALERLRARGRAKEEELLAAERQFLRELGDGGKMAGGENTSPGQSGEDRLDLLGLGDWREDLMASTRCDSEEERGSEEEELASEADRAGDGVHAGTIGGGGGVVWSSGNRLPKGVFDDAGDEATTQRNPGRRPEGEAVLPTPLPPSDLVADLAAFTHATSRLLSGRRPKSSPFAPTGARPRSPRGPAQSDLLCALRGQSTDTFSDTCAPWHKYKNPLDPDTARGGLVGDIVKWANQLQDLRCFCYVVEHCSDDSTRFHRGLNLVVARLWDEARLSLQDVVVEVGRDDFGQDFCRSGGEAHDPDGSRLSSAEQHPDLNRPFFCASWHALAKELGRKLEVLFTADDLHGGRGMDHVDRTSFLSFVVKIHRKLRPHLALHTLLSDVLERGNDVDFRQESQLVLLRELARRVVCTTVGAGAPGPPASSGGKLRCNPDPRRLSKEEDLHNDEFFLCLWRTCLAPVQRELENWNRFGFAAGTSAGVPSVGAAGRQTVSRKNFTQQRKGPKLSLLREIFPQRALEAGRLTSFWLRNWDPNPLLRDSVLGRFILYDKEIDDHGVSFLPYSQQGSRSTNEPSMLLGKAHQQHERPFPQHLAYAAALVCPLSRMREISLFSIKRAVDRSRTVSHLLLAETGRVLEKSLHCLFTVSFCHCDDFVEELIAHVLHRDRLSASDFAQIVARLPDKLKLWSDAEINSAIFAGDDEYDDSPALRGRGRVDRAQALLSDHEHDPLSSASALAFCAQHLTFDGRAFGFRDLPPAIPDFFSPPALRSYARLFRFILEVKATKRLVQNVPIRGLNHQVALVRSEVLHFLSSLEGYVRARAEEAVTKNFGSGVVGVDGTSGTVVVFSAPAEGGAAPAEVDHGSSASSGVEGADRGPPLFLGEKGARSLFPEFFLGPRERTIEQLCAQHERFLRETLQTCVLTDEDEVDDFNSALLADEETREQAPFFYKGGEDHTGGGVYASSSGSSRAAGIAGVRADLRQLLYLSRVFACEIAVVPHQRGGGLEEVQDFQKRFRNVLRFSLKLLKFCVARSSHDKDVIHLFHRLNGDGFYIR